MSIVTEVQATRTYIVRRDSEAEAQSVCSLATNTAERFQAKVLKQNKLRDGAYLLGMYFTDVTLIKDWETRTGINTLLPTGRTFIISDNNEAGAITMCSRAKDMAAKCMGTLLMEQKLSEGIYLMMLFFRDEALMGFWQSSLGVK